MKVKNALIVTILALLAGYMFHTVPVAASSPHVPGIDFHQSLEQQTADLSNIVTITAPTGGADYRISLYGNTVSGTNPGVLAVNYDDGITPEPTDECAIALAPFGSKTCLVHVAAGRTLVVSSQNTQNVGPVTYNAYVTIEEF